MERTLSQDERIRRAEEIYARRQNLREKTKKATLNVSNSQPRNFRLLKRLVLQIVICLLIYCIFYLVNTTNYSFSEGAMNKTEELISKDVDFAGIYHNVVNTIGSHFSSSQTEEETTENVMEMQEENSDDENQIEENTETGSEETNENIAVSADVQEETGQSEITDVELSETERIKQQYSFIVPVSRKYIIGIWRKRSYIKYNVYIS